ncbi:MAG: hypothetical protein ACI38A_11805 [Candidatus Ornithomonoglobus sp.]
MKIKILTSCSGLDFSYAEGDIVEVKTEIGKDLIKAGYAEEIKGITKRDTKKKPEAPNADA